MNTERPLQADGFGERTYRDRFSATDLVYFNVCVEQTDLRIGIGHGIGADLPSPAAVAEARRMALQEVHACRETIITQIHQQPSFLVSLTPLPFAGKDPDASSRMHQQDLYLLRKQRIEDGLVHQMLAAGLAAGVGPMAAVAGAVAEQVGRKLSSLYREVIVENGGDLWVCGAQPRLVGIWCGQSILNGKLALRLPPHNLPMGLCTSSGTVGHSLSFGRADAATVSARTAALADSVATALGNRIRTAENLEPALTWAMKIPGVHGVLAVLGDKLGVMGSMTIASEEDSQS